MFNNRHILSYYKLFLYLIATTSVNTLILKKYPTVRNMWLKVYAKRREKTEVIHDMCHCLLYIFPVLCSFMTYHRVCNQINTTGVTSRAGTAYPSATPEFTPGFQRGSCSSIFSFICMFCRSLVVLLYFFCWPLFCLFFDIQILITPLVSSNSYYSDV